MKTQVSTTFWARIYLAGPIEIAKQFIRMRAIKTGMCVTVTPTTYMYTGGEEEGYIVEFINYPRFPKPHSDIWTEAIELAHELREATGQHSFTVSCPEDTFWYSIREQ